MSAHTPGPWIMWTKPGTHETDGITFAHWGIGTLYDTMLIATAQGASVGTPVVNRLALEMEANARLIAASPDMLEALKRILEQVEDTGTVNQHEGQRARAAIAKAEGLDADHIAGANKKVN